jgi:hypothetical protein
MLGTLISWKEANEDSFRIRAMKNDLSEIYGKARRTLTRLKYKEMSASIKSIRLPTDITDIIIAYVIPPSYHNLKIYKPVKGNRIVETFDLLHESTSRWKTLQAQGYKVSIYIKNNTTELRYYDKVK